MSSSQSLPRRQSIQLLSLGLIALLTLVRVVAYDPTPWVWVTVSAAGTAILVGPIMWVARARIPTERRIDLGYVAGGIALLCVPVLLGFGLITGNLLLVMDVAGLGGTVGLTVALLVAKAVIPERLRESTQ